MLKRLACLLFALLLPTLAAAQPVPLPYHTVQGCLGLPGTGCPSAQAIPFSNLLSQLLGLNWAGVARMVPHQGQTANANDCYTLTDPYGNAIPCTSSTTTQGLQEFLNATAANGWPAVTYCQGTEFPSLLEPVIIEATTSVTVPVAQDWSYHSYGCNLNFNVTTVPGLIVDSEGASVFDWDGKIVYNVVAPNGNTITNPSCTVLINPVTNTADGFPGLYAGYFRIKNPVSQPQGGTTTTGVVCINTSTGSTIQQRLDFTEVNPTQGAYFGVLAFGASSTTGLQQTEINIQQLHGALLHAVDIGYTQTNQANYNGNQWKINNIEAPNTSARGIETFGSYDSFDIGTINAAEGGLGIGIVSDTGSANNKFRTLNITGYTSNNYVDNGTCNLWEIGPAATGSSHGSSYPFFGGNTGCINVVAPATASGTFILQPGTAATFTRHGVADANYTALTSDRYIGYSSITATRTVTLPAAASFPAGTPLIIADESGSVTSSINISIARAGSDTVQGGASVNINVALNGLVLESDGTSKWTIVGATSPGLNSVSNALLAQMASHTVKCNDTGSTANAADCTAIDGITIGGTTPEPGTFTSLKEQAGSSSTNVPAGGRLASQLTPAGTPASTAKTTLQTFSLPASTLGSTGQGVHIKAWGTFAANGDSKTVTIDVNGSTFYSSTAQTSSGSNWIIDMEIYKTGSNAQTIWSTGIFQNGIPNSSVATDNATDTSAITINITGQNGTSNANDIVCDGMTVQMIN